MQVLLCKLHVCNARKLHQTVQTCLLIFSALFSRFVVWLLPLLLGMVGNPFPLEALEAHASGPSIAAHFANKFAVRRGAVLAS